MNEIQTRRVKQFRAWKDVLSRHPVKARNPFHDAAYWQAERTPDRTRHAELLDAELQAWEAASDEDFEGFERSLE